MSRESIAVRQLAAELATLQRRVADLGQPQLAHSSFEDGAIQEYAGETLVQRIGVQFDGTHTVAQFGGPVPPAPTLPFVEARAGGLLVRWDGEFADGALAPMDFARVEVHVSDDVAYTPSRTTVVSTIETPQGAEIFLALPRVPQHVRLLTRSQSGKPSDTTEQVTATPLPAGSRIRVEDAAPTDDTPGGTEGDVWWQRGEGSSVTAQWTWDGTTWQPTPISGTLIAFDTLVGQHVQAGTITADRFESVMVLVNELIAGDRLGSHLSLSPLGLRVYTDDPVDDVPNLAIRLATGDADFLGIIGSDGRARASIDESGVVSGSSFTTQGDVAVAGRPVVGPAVRRHLPGLSNRAWTSWMDALPHGIVGRGRIESNSQATDNATGVGIFEIDVTMASGRLFEIRTSSLRILGSVTNTFAEVRLVYTRTVGTVDTPPVRPTAPDVFSSVLGRAIGQVGDPTAEPLMIANLHAPTGINDSEVGRLYRYRIMLMILRPAGTLATAGSVSVGATAADPAEVWVSDIGPMIANGGQMTTGGVGTGTPATGPVRTYVQEFDASWIQTYRGNGAPYESDGGQAYQGYGGSSYVGVARSMIGFPDLTSFFAGRTINNLEIYLYFSHWWNNTGGTASIGLHGATAQVASYAFSAEQVVFSSGWPKPGDRWVQLPASTYGLWANGGYRGITLRPPGDSTNREYYGVATAARIRATVTG